MNWCTNRDLFTLARGRRRRQEQSDGRQDGGSAGHLANRRPTGRGGGDAAFEEQLAVDVVADLVGGVLDAHLTVGGAGVEGEAARPCRGQFFGPGQGVAESGEPLRPTVGVDEEAPVPRQGAGAGAGRLRSAPG